MKTLSLIGLVLFGFLMPAFAKAATTIPDTYFYCYPNYYGYSLPQDATTSEAEEEDQYLADNSDSDVSDFPYYAYPDYYPNYSSSLSYPAYSYAAPDTGYYSNDGYEPYSYGYYPYYADLSYSHFWPYFGLSPYWGWGGYCPGLFSPNFGRFFCDNDNIFRHHDRDFHDHGHGWGWNNNHGWNNGSDHGNRFSDRSFRGNRGNGDRNFANRSGVTGRGENRGVIGGRSFTSPRGDPTRARASNPGIRTPGIRTPNNPIRSNQGFRGSAPLNPRAPALGNPRGIAGGTRLNGPSGGRSFGSRPSLGSAGVRSFGGGSAIRAPGGAGARSFGGPSAIRAPSGGGRSFGGGSAIRAPGGGGARSFGGGGGGRSFGGGGGGGGHGGGGHR